MNAVAEWVRANDIEIYKRMVAKRERQDAWIARNYPNYQSLDRNRQIEILCEAKKHGAYNCGRD